jgi:hypothetical protein
MGPSITLHLDRVSPARSQLLKIDEAIQKSENEITVGTSVTEPTEIKKAAA